jgi:3-phosphoshikimate 1-carboxyvinyltransferase
VRCEAAGSRAMTVHGVNGVFPGKKADLFLGNAGTVVRPLTAVLALCGGEYGINGVARMHERPIGDLVDALHQLGAQIDYLGKPGFPPLKIHPRQRVQPVPDRIADGAAAARHENAGAY